MQIPKQRRFAKSQMMSVPKTAFERDRKRWNIRVLGKITEIARVRSQKKQHPPCKNSRIRRLNKQIDRWSNQTMQSWWRSFARCWVCLRFEHAIPSCNPPGRCRHVIRACDAYRRSGRCRRCSRRWCVGRHSCTPWSCSEACGQAWWMLLFFYSFLVSSSSLVWV